MGRDRGQLVGTPLPLVFGAVAVVLAVVLLEVIERQRAATPAGADLGWPAITPGVTLAVVGLLIVVGGVLVVLRRRVGD